MKHDRNAEGYTRREIARDVSRRTGLPATIVTDVIKEFEVCIRTRIEQGHEVFIPSLFTAKFIHKKEKIGRDINRKTPVLIPSHIRLKFMVPPSLQRNVIRYWINQMRSSNAKVAGGDAVIG